MYEMLICITRNVKDKNYDITTHQQNLKQDLQLKRDVHVPKGFDTTVWP